MEAVITLSGRAVSTDQEMGGYARDLAHYTRLAYARSDKALMQGELYVITPAVRFAGFESVEVVSEGGKWGFEYDYERDWAFEDFLHELKAIAKQTERSAIASAYKLIEVYRDLNGGIE